MEVCKFFLQGRCTFGERCRFEHTSRFSQDDHDDLSHHNNRYEVLSNHRSKEVDSYHVDTYQPSHNVRDRLGPQQQQLAGHFGYQDNRRSETRNYRTDHHQTHQQPYYDDNYDNHPYDASTYSYDYGGERGRGAGIDHNSSQNYTGGAASKYKYTADKSSSQSMKGSYQKTQPLDNQTRETDADFNIDEAIASIAEDMTCWETSGMWTFSCFAFTKETRSFPELDDISFEEARLSAYDAMKIGQLSNYISSAAQLSYDYKKKREVLSNLNQMSSNDIIVLFQHLRDTTYKQVTPMSHPTQDNFLTFSASSNISPLIVSSERSVFNISQGSGLQSAGIQGTTATAANSQKPFGFISAAPSSSIAAFGFASTSSKESNPLTGISSDGTLLRSSVGINLFRAVNIEPVGQKSIVEPNISLTGGSSYQLYSQPLLHSCIDDLTVIETTQYEASKFTGGMIPHRPPAKQYV